MSEKIAKVLSNVAQSFTSDEKECARRNIGAQAELTAGPNVDLINNVLSTEDTYVSSAIPQLSGMDISPCPRLNLNVSFLGEPSNRVYIVKPSEPLPEPPYVGGGQFLQLNLRDVTCDRAATLKMKAELFKITPTQYVWRYPWQY